MLKFLYLDLDQVYSKYTCCILKKGHFMSVFVLYLKNTFAIILVTFGELTEIIAWI